MKETEKIVHISNVIKSLDGKVEYSVDFVRDRFMKSPDNLEQLATEMNLPVEVVKHHAMLGPISWMQLKQETLAKRLQHFANLDTEDLLETHSALEDGHFLTLAQLKMTQQFLKKYLDRYGHLWKVDETGEISLDPYGMPIPLPIPNSPKHFMALEGYLRLKEGTKQAMNHMYEQLKEKEKPTVIDIEEDDIFKETE